MVSLWKGRGNIQRHLDGSRAERESSRLDRPGLRKQSREIRKIARDNTYGHLMNAGFYLLVLNPSVIYLELISIHVAFLRSKCLVRHLSHMHEAWYSKTLKV